MELIQYEVENCPKKCKDCKTKKCDFKNELVNIFEQIEIGNWNEERLHQMIKFKVVKIKTNKPDVEMIKEQTNENGR